MQKRIAINIYLAAILCIASFADAAQFVALDKDYVHSSWHYKWSMDNQPGNWKSPDNYYEGITYFRCEVFEIKNFNGTFNAETRDGVKKSAKYFCPQICFFQDKQDSDHHCCFSSRNIRINGTGVYYGKESPSTMWNKGFADWSRKLNPLMVIGKSDEPYARIYRGHDVHMRYEAICVAKNDKFVLPGHWSGTPQDWNVEGAVAANEPSSMRQSSIKNLYIQQGAAGDFVAVVRKNGSHTLELWGVDGRLRTTRTGHGPARYSFGNDMLGQGIFLARLKTADGTVVIKTAAR